jgi:hypothetical protein
MGLTMLFINHLNAAEKYIHFWQANNINWMTGIQLTNICTNELVTVTLQLWNSNGDTFSNQQISAIKNDSRYIVTTDENGKVKINLNAHTTASFVIDKSVVTSYKSGNGKITSYTESGKSCLIGGHAMERYDNGATFSYTFNNGNPF